MSGNEYEFIGGPFHSQIRAVDVIANVDDGTHFYEPRRRGTEIVFVHAGPRGECPGCWKGPVQDGQACAKCDRVSNLMHCVDCTAIMAATVGFDEMRSNAIRNLTGRVANSLRVENPSKVTWRCGCGVGRATRRSNICPRCGADGRDRRVMGPIRKYQCTSTECGHRYEFGPLHFDETPARLEAEALPEV